jgi:3-hydroxyisobutyrate dehydrogenase
VANAWVLTVVQGISQSLSLAEALDLDPHAFLDVVRGGALDAGLGDLDLSATHLAR